MRALTQKIIIICVILSLTLCLNIDNQLPDLITNTFTQKVPDHINVTLGQEFSIVLPQFDLHKIPNDFKVYEITQEKFFNMFETLEKHDTENTADSLNELESGIFTCKIKEPAMYISKTIDSISVKAAGYFDYRAEQSIIYVPIMIRSLLYTLDTSTMEISVYHFTEKSLTFLSSNKIAATYNKPQIKISMASSSTQQYIYVFSSEGMWSIETKTVLTNIKKIYPDKIGGFDSTKTFIDKLIHGNQGYIYGLQRNRAVYLIPENEVMSLKSIDSFKGQQISPQDVFIESRTIYVLGAQSGIYVYRVLGTGQIQEVDKISLQTFSNRQIMVKENSIFVKYNDQEGQKIIEINYDQEKHQAKLVRYYKSDEIITSMNIFLAIVSAQQKYSQSAVDPLLFLTADNGQIQVYPYNIDPRTILNVHNGPKMHVDGVQKIFALYTNHYLLVTPSQIIYAEISIQKPEIVCKLPESTGHLYYLMEFSSNISTCEHYDHSLSHKKKFSSNCELKESLIVYINDPELSRMQKILLYGVVLLVVGGFIVGVLCLIQWRDNKLSLIGRIKDEIIRFRDRHRKMQPFNEEEDNKTRQVQFEMPEPIKQIKDDDQ